jgi:hypothetical protein
MDDVHVISGPSAAACLQQGMAPPPDAVLVHNDMLSWGPLPLFESLNAWRHLREGDLRSLDLQDSTFTFAEQARDLLTNCQRLRNARPKGGCAIRIVVSEWADVGEGGNREAVSPPSHVACRPKHTRSFASVSEGWSGLRGSNPCPRLGKPLYYHCTKPARDVRLKPDATELLVENEDSF